PVAEGASREGGIHVAQHVLSRRIFVVVDGQRVATLSELRQRFFERELERLDRGRVGRGHDRASPVFFQPFGPVRTQPSASYAASRSSLSRAYSFGQRPDGSSST